MDDAIDPPIAVDTISTHCDLKLWTLSRRLNFFFFLVQWIIHVAQSVASLTVDQKIWESIPLMPKQSAIFSVHLNRQSRLFWWFRVDRSLLPNFPGGLSLSAESPMVGAYVKP
jgi:hypothetical protein